MPKLKKFLKDESGATAIEYGLIAAATGLALAATLPTLTTNLEARFNDVNSALI
ncbi:Flp pilus assembly protein, pilin Flp [hydrothermal vent metagenome]|uniref:Flp pilus assembly protein, pilin Flp n=1 Tax=hydrothermal vent metagenome TaxID=652676 RepID=A0A3B0SF95_9ZZZZ